MAKLPFSIATSAKLQKNAFYKEQVTLLKVYVLTEILDSYSLSYSSFAQKMKYTESYQVIRYLLTRSAPWKWNWKYDGCSGCDLNPFLFVDILASMTMNEVQALVDRILDSSWYSRIEKDERFAQMRAFHAFLRMRPDILRLFGPMPDFPIPMPDEAEVLEAEKTWNCLIQKRILFNSSDYLNAILEALKVVPGMEDLYLVRSDNDIIRGFMGRLCSYQDLRFLSQSEQDEISRLLAKAEALNLYWARKLQDDQVLLQYFLATADVDGALARMHPDTTACLALKGLRLMLEGKDEEAFKLMNKWMTSNKYVNFGNFLKDYIYFLSMLRAKTPLAIKRSITVLKSRDFQRSIHGYGILRFFAVTASQPETDLENLCFQLNVPLWENRLCELLFLQICRHYQTLDRKDWKTILPEQARRVLDSGSRTLAILCAGEFPDLAPAAAGYMKTSMVRPLLPAYSKAGRWETILEAIITRHSLGEAARPANARTSRIVYEVSSQMDVQPRLLKSSDGGQTWTRGRNIALQTFRRGIPEMTPQDLQVASKVTENEIWYSESNRYSLSGAEAMEALVGNPNVVDSQNPDLGIDVVSESFQILVKESEGGYMVTSNLPLNKLSEGGTFAIRENPKTIRVIRVTDQEADIYTKLKSVGVFPQDSRPRLKEFLGHLSKRCTVVSRLLDNASGVAIRKGSGRLTVQIVPSGEIFRVICLSQPIAGQRPYCTPGKGLELVAGIVKGKPVQVERNLRAEALAYSQFMEWMNPFDTYHDGDGWEMPMQECLSLLEMLRTRIQQEKAKMDIEWPQGGRFTVQRPMIGSGQLSLSLSGVGQWFEVDGEVRLDESTVLKLSELLEKVRQAQGDFIRLGDEEYVALSRQLRRQLQALDRVAERDRRRLRVSQLNSGFLESMAQDGIHLAGDEAYSRLLERISEASGRDFEVPGGLQVPLRDYQKDGYRWLCRLAAWAPGACLADDMGLGKTVQAIALLLSRASLGPALVVMPSSVLMNWDAELRRFAPSLRVVILQNARDRAASIRSLEPGDVLLSTYGLLPIQEEALSERKFSTIILDEAQAIRNRETLTSHSVHRLMGDFRLLLSGTPIQNHLSEIWNLFGFATPGLLGSYEAFTRDFILPIERDRDKDRQKLLKRILSPFLLRRTKEDVLSELPDKTEVVLKVELSDAERALYEMIRQEALESLHQSGATAIRALAELTRLRQAACNPRLVGKAGQWPEDAACSKMEMFLSLVDDLRQGGHRALVFSQFTSHLALIRKELDDRGITYCYLDGSMSATERQKAVRSFQEGQMPLFLVSLKAGGLGLNLTAADFVIHMDPWWNPAVEDQATDRSHRIGQDKAVTVYRLISSDTVEERILELHETKRSLADALLEGADMSQALTRDEILSIISQSRSLF